MVAIGENLLNGYSKDRTWRERLKKRNATGRAVMS
jgi:hypothetical protein